MSEQNRSRRLEGKEQEAALNAASLLAATVASRIVMPAPEAGA